LASSAKRRATIKKRIKEPTYAYLRLYDKVRRMRTLRRHLSLGHHAHR
jgi:hypothetical protein